MPLTVTILLLALIGVAVVWSHRIEPYRIQRVHRTIALPNLKRPLRILHLSDFHFRRQSGDKTERILTAIDLTDVDLILLGGDYLERLDGIELLERVLERLTAPLGIFAVKGNHEVYDYGLYHLINGKATKGYPKDIRRLLDLFERYRIRFLDNEHVKLDDDLDIHLIGVHDYFTGRCDVKRAMRNLPENGARIMLSHSPEAQTDLDRLSALSPDRYRVDLLVAGHTHGGQVRLPLLGVIASRSALPVHKITGCYLSSGPAVSISNGLGEGKLFPFRFRCPPQIVLVDLIPGATPEIVLERRV